MPTYSILGENSKRGKLIYEKTCIKYNTKCSQEHVAPEIYGQFSEHLGRCIYDGVYVGEDSDIPNTNGMLQ